MSLISLDRMITIPQAAERFGVTRQRMHQLIGTYGVATVFVSPKLKMVDVKELAKIPAKRPPGPRRPTK